MGTGTRGTGDNSAVGLEPDAAKEEVVPEHSRVVLGPVVYIGVVYAWNHHIFHPPPELLGFDSVSKCHDEWKRSELYLSWQRCSTASTVHTAAQLCGRSDPMQGRTLG